MNLETFKATKHSIPAGSVEMPDHINDLIIGDTTVSAVLVYEAETWIAQRHNGQYWLILGRDEYESGELADLEPLLFNWYKTECEA